MRDEKAALREGRGNGAGEGGANRVGCGRSRAFGWDGDVRVESPPCRCPSSILASFFRQHSPRSPVPPSSFPSGLQPVASNDINGPAGRRSSRTDLDFEQALRAGGTVVLREGLDVDKLGVGDNSNASISFSSSPSPPQQRGYLGLQPATPIIVPPTPSPGNSAARPGLAPSSNLTSPSSSTSEVFYDAPEDIDYQTRRRSMYRSPGTASSPDLATLLRKAKERGGVGSNKDGKKSSNSSSRERTYCHMHACPFPHYRRQPNRPSPPHKSPRSLEARCGPHRT